MNDFETTDYVGRSGQIQSVSAEKDFLNEHVNQRAAFVIVTLDDNKMIGTVCLEEFNDIDRTATLGIFIGDKKYRSKGSDGELVDEKYNKYTWKITDDTTLTATYYSAKTATITIDIDDDLLKDDKTDLSDSSNLKSEINSANGVKYEDMVSKFGTNGYMVEKRSSGTSYMWVNKDGGYIKANFSNGSGKCTSFFGRV